jgi:hypothetical protein
MRHESEKLYTCSASSGFYAAKQYAIGFLQAGKEIKKKWNSP